jgi:L-asparaginase
VDEVGRPIWHRYDEGNRGHGVLVVYTGGTIGSMPRDPLDPTSPLVVVDWAEFRRRTSSLSERLADGSRNERHIGFNVDGCSLTPVDSCNIGPEYWVEIARVIAERYDDYEGFVVLHGTDTMVYTASALSFMLRDLGKPVIVTGAQIPHLRSVRNDALQNLITALLLAHPAHAGLPLVPEVGIYFYDALLRGNRARKVNASGFRAFRSPNYPPLAVAGERIAVDERVLRAARPGAPLATHLTVEPDVVAVHVFPGIQRGSLLPHILADESLKGVVIMAYGAGTLPNEAHVLRAIEAAVRRGVVAVAVTQCGGGRVDLGRYEAGTALREAGCVSGADMTPEAALVKLMVLLGDPGLSVGDVRRAMERDLSGELTVREAPESG